MSVYNVNQIAKDLCSVQPMDHNLIKECWDSIESKPLLPKNLQLKHEYVEVSRGINESYEEKIIRKDGVKQAIDEGWSITRLSKVSPSMVKSKWINAIIAMGGIK